MLKKNWVCVFIHLGVYTYKWMDIQCKLYCIYISIGFWYQTRKKKKHQIEKNWENKTIKIKRKRKNSQESNKFGYFESHWICVLFVAKIPYKEADYIIITGSFFFIYFFLLSFELVLCYLVYISWMETHLNGSNIKLSRDHIVLTATIGPTIALVAYIHILTHLKMFKEKPKRFKRK